MRNGKVLDDEIKNKRLKWVSILNSITSALFLDLIKWFVDNINLPKHAILCKSLSFATAVSNLLWRAVAARSESGSSIKSHKLLRISSVFLSFKLYFKINNFFHNSFFRILTTLCVPAVWWCNPALRVLKIWSQSQICPLYQFCPHGGGSPRRFADQCIGWCSQQLAHPIL